MRRSERFRSTTSGSFYGHGSSPALVAAGFPSPGEEWRERGLDVQQLFGLAGEGSFCFRMAGTALAGAGIMDNDILVISPAPDAQNNDLVMATVNGKLYVRRLVVHRDTSFLLAANLYPAGPDNLHALGAVYPPLQVKPEDDFRIRGVVLCSIHALHQHARRQALLRLRGLADLNLLLDLYQPGTFMTQVKGSSMHGASIFSGDVLVVNRELPAVANDIIVATLEGGFVVKRLLQARDTQFLLSEHPLIPPIVATSEVGFQVWGVVLFCLHPVHQLVKDRLIQQRRKPGR